jgi:hypothetical protein
MKSSGNKIETIAIITIILMMTSVMLMAMPVQAQSELQVVTHAYLSFTPNPIGLGQAILVNVWTTPPVNLYRNQRSEEHTSELQSHGT